MQYRTVFLPETGFVRLPLLVGDKKTGTPGLVPLSKTTIWRRVAAGTFPKPIKLSERVTAWKAEDIRAWLDQQAA
jgi:hypothetical protein